jgi:hypothetical protein
MDPSWTIGIDLSAQSANTSACVIEWTRNGATILRLSPEGNDAKTGLDDHALLRLIEQFPGKVGIDCPFGSGGALAPPMFRRTVLRSV